MGWIARLRAGAERVHVWHGAEVSVEGPVFWEGLNPALTDPRQVTRHHFPLCSGGATENDQVVFFTPGHVLDRLFGLRDNDSFWIANSLPLLLGATGQALAESYMFYPWEFETIDRHDRALPLSSGQPLHVFYNCNITVDDQLNHQPSVRPTRFTFDSFSVYASALRTFIGEALGASGRGGNGRFLPLSSLSRGYDSTAVTVLAREFGVGEALSIGDARGCPDGSEDVTGSADLLGLRLHRAHRDDFRQCGLEAERLFYVTALAEDICLFPFKDVLRGRLFFCGYHGDTMWDRSARPVGTWRRDNAGASLQEFRIRTGFVLLPPAFFGCQHHRAIIDISNSAAMEKWSVGGAYDRPIPRRIAEEAGMPRSWFGTEKMAVTVSAGQRAEDDRVSPELQALLDEQWNRVSSPTDIALRQGANFLNRSIISAQRLYSGSGPGPGSGPNASGLRTAGRLSSLKKQVAGLVKYSQVRRKFIRPIQPITFAAQVTSRLVASEYAGLFGW
jgi:hypothetical protein